MLKKTLKTLPFVLSMAFAAGLHAQPLKAEVDVVAKPVEVLTEVRQVPLKELTSQHGTSSDVAIFGFARTSPQISADFDVLYAENADGSISYAPKILLNFEYSPVQLHVANEIQADSCGYKSVVAHEQSHVANYDKILNDQAAVMQAKVAAAMPATAVAASVDDARAALQATLPTLLAPYIDEAAADVHAQQVALNKPFSRNQLKDCNGELLAVLKHHGA